MAEALMLAKRAIAVTDWLIPDTTPSRYAIPADYAILSTKKTLRTDIEKYLSSPESYSTVFQKGKNLFQMLKIVVPILWMQLNTYIR